MKNKKTVILIVSLSLFAIISLSLLLSMRSIFDYMDSSFNEESTEAEGEEIGSSIDALTSKNARVVYELDSTGMYAYAGVCVDGLKPNTRYLISYTIDPMFNSELPNGETRAYFPYIDVDKKSYCFYLNFCYNEGDGPGGICTMTSTADLNNGLLDFWSIEDQPCAIFPFMFSHYDEGSSQELAEYLVKNYITKLEFIEIDGG